MEVLANHFFFQGEPFINLKKMNFVKPSRKASRNLRRKLFIFHCFLKFTFIPHTTITDSTICPKVCELALIATILNKIELIYQVCYTRYKVSFYLWQIGLVLEYCKVPKYYNQKQIIECVMFAIDKITITW